MKHALILLDRVPSSGLPDISEKTVAQVPSEGMLPNQHSMKEINSALELIRKDRIRKYSDWQSSSVVKWQIVDNKCGLVS